MHLCIQCRIPHRGGLPHSDTPGSKLARSSSGIFAACHVLHRLLVPRHPPNALLLLNQSNQHRNNRRRRRGQNISLRHRTALPSLDQSLIHAISNDIADMRYQTISQTHTTFGASVHCNTTALRKTPPNKRDQHGSDKPYGSYHGHLPSPPIAAGSENPPATARKPSCPTRPETHQNLIHMYKRPKHPARTTHALPNGSDAGKPAPISIPSQTS